MSVHTPSTPGRDGPPKATLFCPVCGHENAPTGDWVTFERDGDAVYECPVCGTEIATRGRSEIAQHA